MDILRYHLQVKMVVSLIHTLLFAYKKLTKMCWRGTAKCSKLLDNVYHFTVGLLKIGTLTAPLILSGCITTIRQ